MIGDLNLKTPELNSRGFIHLNYSGCLLEQDSKYENAWANKGNCLLKKNRYEEALQCYNKALELDVENAEVWFNGGNCLYELKMYEEAIKAYKEALNLDPELEGVNDAIKRASEMLENKCIEEEKRRPTKDDTIIKKPVSHFIICSFCGERNNKINISLDCKCEACGARLEINEEDEFWDRLKQKKEEELRKEQNNLLEEKKGREKAEQEKRDLEEKLKAMDMDRIKAEDKFKAAEAKRLKAEEEAQKANTEIEIRKAREATAKAEKAKAEAEAEKLKAQIEADKARKAKEEADKIRMEIEKTKLKSDLETYRQKPKPSNITFNREVERVKKNWLQRLFSR